MIPLDLFPALVSGAREAVWDAFCSAHAATKRAVPHELEHVYALMSAGTRSLADRWSPLLKSRGISIRVTGVFIHQTPMTRYLHPVDGLVGPELGDLLIVHEHAGRAARRQALLTQVKRCTDGVPSGPPDEHQQFLYREWPDFVLKGHGRRGTSPYLPGTRTLRPNSGGSSYALVADDMDPCDRCSICTTEHSYSFPWILSDPTDEAGAAGGEDLGSVIANMLYERSWPRGRRAERLNHALTLSAPDEPNNHFDVTIEELLRITAKRTMAFKRYRQIRGRRHRTVSCFQHLEFNGGPLPAIGDEFTPTSGGADGGGDIIGTEEPQPEGGISLLLIETGREE